VTLHKQNNNDGEIENQTNEKMIRKNLEELDTCGNKIAFLLL
jgi:hypothetical protein